MTHFTDWACIDCGVIERRPNQRDDRDMERFHRCGVCSGERRAKRAAYRETIQHQTKAVQDD